MAKIRILVVDDAVVYRRLLADELGKDPALEVVGTAANGRIALQKMSQVNPDVVILDLEMPEMNGLETLTELRKIYPRLPVIMFSALTERGASETLDALSLGATSYFTKPSNTGSLEASLEVLRSNLIPEIKEVWAAAQAKAAMKATSRSSDGTANRPSPSKAFFPPPANQGKIDVVVIGSSTGGPNALAEVFAKFPADFPVPILLVQHMPPTFTRQLAERLTAEFSLKVQEAVSGVVPQPGEAWIAPGNYHAIVVRDGTQSRLLVHQDPPENSCRPSVDVLFRSAAKTYGSGVLGVILTGMGQDGLRGCEAIREAGGKILAQDEASSVVWGMPGFVVRAGLADRVLPLSLIGNEIVQRVFRGDGGT